MSGLPHFRLRLTSLSGASRKKTPKSKAFISYSDDDDDDESNDNNIESGERRQEPIQTRSQSAK